MSMKWQVGLFFFILGLLLSILYFMTQQGQSPIYSFLCAGVLGVLLGGAMMWWGRNPPVESNRFRLYRQMSESRKKRKEEKQQNVE